VKKIRGGLPPTVSQALRRLPSRNMPPVLVYHEVGNELPRAAPAMTIDADRFERQIRWLAELGYTGITVSRWLSIRGGREGGPSRPVLITFDDGYAGVGEYALPALHRHGFTGTVFLVTSKLGGVNDWDPYAAGQNHRLMSAEQVRRWSGEGIEFGGHTRSHPDLTALSRRRMDEEVAGCHADLAELLGTPPRSFAYPYGFENKQVREVVSRWFDAAFIVDERANRPSTDVYRLYRSGALPQDSRGDMTLRLLVGWTPRHQLVMRMRRRVGRLRRRLGLVSARRA
jgi:peptidoglycan/xylan/chitin deacetylase (PgdA/CDA1 family)